MIHHSRTDKKEKGPGYEYWGPRPLNFKGGIPGRWTKTKTHRLERIRAKRELDKDINDEPSSAQPEVDQIDHDRLSSRSSITSPA